MSSTSPAAPQLQASSNSTAPSTANSIKSAPDQQDATPTPAKVNPFAVSAIPAFRGPVNYAAAASKSKPSPPALNGKDAVASVTNVSSQAAASKASPAQNPAPPTITVPAVAAPTAKKDTVKNGATPATGAPSSNGNPKALATPSTASPAPSSKPSINLHAFFGAGGSSSPSLSSVNSSGGTPIDRRTSSGYDVQGGRSPQSNSTNLQQHQHQQQQQQQGAHPSQLSSNSQAFAPRSPFLSHGQQQGQPGFSPSPQPQFAHLGPPGSSPYQQHPQAPQNSSYVQKPSQQNIPNGAPYGGPGGPGSVGLGQQPGASNGPGGIQQRNSSFIGSPIMQPPRQGGTPGPRGNFGATSPRLSNVGLPQGPMMYAHWQQQQAYGAQYPNYYGMQAYPPPASYTSSPSGGGPPTLATSGSSTPSTGVRTPSVAGAVGVPPSPSPSQSMVPTHSASSSAAHVNTHNNNASGSFQSPQSQSVALSSSSSSHPVGAPLSSGTSSTISSPFHHAHVGHSGPTGHSKHPSLGGIPAGFDRNRARGPTGGVVVSGPVGMGSGGNGTGSPASPFTLQTAAHAMEFKPSGDAPAFVPPTPRKSMAIKIRNPKDVLAEKEAKAKAEAEAAAAASASTSTDGTNAPGTSTEAPSAKVTEKKSVQEEAATAAEKEAGALRSQKDKEEKDKAAATASAVAAQEEQKVKNQKADDEIKAAKEKLDLAKAKEEKAAVEKNEKAKAAAHAEAETKRVNEQEEKAAAEKAKAEAAAKKKKIEEAAAAATAAATAATAATVASAAKLKADKDTDLAASKKAEEERATKAKVDSAVKDEADKASAAQSKKAKETAEKDKAVTTDAGKEKTAPATTSVKNTTGDAQVFKVKGASADADQKEPSAATALPSFLPAKPTVATTETKPKAAGSSAAPKTDTSTGVVTAAALASARPIENLKDVSYPENIKSPKANLNVESEPGKYRYDREFLLQFMNVCTEKPEQLPDLEKVGMIDAGADMNSIRAASFAGRRPSSMGPPAIPVGRNATPSSFGRSGAAAGSAFGGMGTFGQATPGTSEARYQASLSGARGSFPNRPSGSMSRTASQSGVILAGANFVPAGSQRIRSDRGKRREESGRGGDRGGNKPGQHTTGQGFEDAAPLQITENRWTPNVVAHVTLGENSPELVQRKVKALLNKLTLERFESISNQILEWANKSVDETDGRILRQVIALIFEKATDEANWSEMYARLCRKLMEQVNAEVKDDTVKTPAGEPVMGGALFRKYLLNRCQEDYESGWKQKEVATAAAADKAADDNAKKEANDAAEKEAKEKGQSTAPKEAELLSDEYYAAQKAKRRGLGLVRFIGELYRLSMLTANIMHECIRKLLSNVDNPEEEDVESLCRLLTTVGKGLDIPRAKQHMDVYFIRMATISNNNKISSRIRFMIQDVIELRAENWTPRQLASGPKLISEIHADAQRAAEESARRTVSSGGRGMPVLRDQMSRPGSRRGQGRDQLGAVSDGWSAPVPSARPTRAGDLGNFGRIREPTAIPTLGPSGAFANKAAKAKEAARPTTPSNPFALLGAEAGGVDPNASGSQRTKLVLAPRTKPIGDEEGDVEGSGQDKAEGAPIEEDEDDGQIDPNAISMSRAEGERRAGNSVKEFYSVKNLAEGVASVEALPVEYRGLLVKAFADAAVDKKADDVNLTRQLFAELANKQVVKHEVMVESLSSIVKNLIDLAVDVPSVYNFASQLLIGAGASRAEVETLSQSMESEEEEEEDVEKGRVLLMTAFDKLQQ